MRETVLRQDKPEVAMQLREDPNFVLDVLSRGATPRQNLVCDSGVCGTRGTEKCPRHAPEGVCPNYRPAFSCPEEMDDTMAAFLVAGSPRSR